MLNTILTLEELSSSNVKYYFLWGSWFTEEQTMDITLCERGVSLICRMMRKEEMLLPFRG